MQLTILATNNIVEKRNTYQNNFTIKTNNAKKMYFKSIDPTFYEETLQKKLGSMGWLRKTFLFGKLKAMKEAIKEWAEQCNKTEFANRLKGEALTSQEKHIQDLTRFADERGTWLDQRDIEFTRKNTFLEDKEKSLEIRESGVRRQEQVLAEKTQGFTSQEGQLSQKTAQVEVREGVVSSRERELETREKVVASRAEELDSRGKELNIKESSLQTREGDLISREQAVAIRENKAELREQCVTKKEKALSEREERVQDSLIEIERIKNEGLQMLADAISEKQKAIEIKGSTIKLEEDFINGDVDIQRLGKEKANIVKESSATIAKLLEQLKGKNQ